MNIHDALKAKLEEFERASKHAQRVLDALGTADSKRFEELRAALGGSPKLTKDMLRLIAAFGGSLKLTEDMQRVSAERDAAAKQIAAARSAPLVKFASLHQPKRRRRRPGF